MPPTTRRTRAHPSPTGLKSLEMTTTKKKKKTSNTTSKVTKTSKTAKNTQTVATSPAIVKLQTPAKPEPSSPAPVPAVDLASSNFPTSPDAFGISDDEEEPQPSFVHALNHDAESNSITPQEEEEEEEEDTPSVKDDLQVTPTTPMPASTTPPPPTPTMSSWAKLSNLTAILSPRNLLRTPLSFWGRRQQENARTSQPGRINAPTTPTSSRPRGTKRVPATISHTRRKDHEHSGGIDSPTKVPPRTTDSRRVGRRPDSHLPLHLRGCLYRDLPKEWQARSAHMRPLEEPAAKPQSSEPLQDATTPAKPRFVSDAESADTSGTLKRKRQNTNPQGKFVAPVMDNSDDEDDATRENSADKIPAHQSSRDPPMTRTPPQTKARAEVTPQRQRFPERTTRIPSSSFYELGGRTYSRIIYPKKSSDFKPSFVVPDLDSDSSDEEDEGEKDEEEELFERPAKRQHIEQTPDNRLDKVRQEALRHASKVPSHLSQVQIMSPAVIAPKFSQKVLDAYANLRLPIIDQELIEIVENWDYTPYLTKFRKRKIESWADPDEDEMRRQGILD